MRVERLSLLRFGPFRDLALEFSTGRLQVVIGSNEAGKSTALRALRGLLYGIPNTTPDAHVYVMKDLLVGARVRSDAGEVLEFMRRKGLKNTLLDASGDALQEDLLAPLLSGTSRDLFESMYGITHEDLTRGGEELLAAGGALGESLFGAALGLRGAHSLARELGQEAGKIFKRDGRKPPLNLALREFRDAQAKVRALQLEPADWARLEAELENHRDRLAACGAALREVETELTRAQRVKRVLPALERRRALREEIEKTEGEGLEVSDLAREEREGAERTLDELGARISQLSAERDAASERRGSLQVPEALLAREDRLPELRGRLGAHRKALVDRSRLEGAAALSREQAQGLLGELGDVSLGDRLLALDAPARLRLRRLVLEGEEKTRALQQTAEQLRRSRDAQSGVEESNAPSASLAEIGALRDALAAATRAEDLPDELQSAVGELAALDEELAKSVAALPLWSEDEDALAACLVPAAETIERFRGAFDELERGRDAASVRLAEAEASVSELATRIALVEREGEVPSEAGLLAARAQREDLWEEVRAHWLHGQGEAVRAPDLARSFEHEVAVADGRADALRKSAARSAEHESLRQQRQSALALVQGEQTKLEAYAKSDAEITARWAAVWREVCAEPLPPVEMRAWLLERDRIVLQVTRRGNQRQRVAVLGRRIEELRFLLSKALGEASLEASTLASLLAQGARTLGALESLEEDRRIREEQRLRAAERLVEVSHEHAEARERHGDWLAQWRDAVGSLGLRLRTGGKLRFEEVEAMLELRERAQTHFSDVRAAERRIEAIDKDAARFEREVRELALEAAPALVDVGLEQAAVRLDALYRQGLADRQEVAAIDGRVREIQQELVALEARVDVAKASLARLCERAGCSSPSELPRLEERSRDRRDQIAELRRVEDEQLRAEGVPVEKLLAEAGSFDEAAIPSCIATLEQEREERRAERDGLQQQVGRLCQDLELRDGRSEAAAAAGEAEQALARVRSGVDRYVRLRLAEWCLRRQVEANRENTQAPLLARAGEWMSSLTLGAYTSLQPGFDTRDELVLELRRADGARVGVPGLSAGTRDQLYLALRLASLEGRLGQGEGLPLVLDDVLVHFDDARSRAALAGLGELAGRTQVMLFTHHARVAELAREAVAEDALEIHDLDAIAASHRVDSPA